VAENFRSSSGNICSAGKALGYSDVPQNPYEIRTSSGQQYGNFQCIRIPQKALQVLNRPGVRIAGTSEAQYDVSNSVSFGFLEDGWEVAIQLGCRSKE
jgi:hypothetical protein